MSAYAIKAFLRATFYVCPFFQISCYYLCSPLPGILLSSQISLLFSGLSFPLAAKKLLCTVLLLALLFIVYALRILFSNISAVIGLFALLPHYKSGSSVCDLKPLARNKQFLHNSLVHCDIKLAKRPRLTTLWLKPPSFCLPGQPLTNCW